MFNHRKLSNSIICLIMVFAFCTANAAQKMKISVSADHINRSENGKESFLKGHAKITVDNHITITGKRMLVKYSGSPLAISECIIYGKGRFRDGERVMKFKNGIFNPQTLKISAEKMKWIN